MSDFLQALRVQRRVVHAILLRETRTRFGRSKLGYFWAFFEPMAYLLTFLAIFSLLDRTSPIPVDIKLFFFTGIVPWLLFSRCVTTVSGAVEANLTLLSYPHVKALDAVLARVILEFSTIFLVAFVYLLIISYLDRSFVVIQSFSIVIVALALATLAGVGLGLIGSVAKLYMPAYGNFQGIFLRFLFFTSGIFFAVGTLPNELREWLYINPMAHIIDWLRSGFFSEYESNFYNAVYPITFTMLALFLGLAAERVTRHKQREV